MFRCLKTAINRLLGLFRPPPRQQVAALCWRETGGEIEILLVTTRNTGRWTPPRGWPMAGKTASEAASQEAWEEAGVIGAAAETPIGAYRYDKFLSKGGIGAPVEVRLFPLEVRKRKKTFPEANQRKQKWMSRNEAANAVRETELKRLIEGFTP